MKHCVNQTETGMKSGLSNARILRWTGLCLTASTLYVGHAMAANGTWTNDVSGSWTNTLNWAEGFVPGGADTDAIAFTNDITADRTVTLDGNRIVNSVTFGDADTNSAAGWTLNPGTGGGLVLAGSTPTLIVNTLATNKVVMLSAGISGSNGLTKAGLGTLTLTATNNTYSGDTVIAAGTLLLNPVPEPPSSGLALWLDATRGVTTNSGGKVTVWADQSGNNRNASNSGSSGPSVTADINGLPTLRFTRSSSQFLSAGGLGGVSNLTLFIVHKDATLNALQTYIATDGTWRDDGTYGKSVHFITANSAGFRIDYAVNPGDGYGTTTIAAGVAQIDEIVDNSGPYQLYMNGAPNGSASRATVLKNLNAFRIGTWDQQSRFLDSSIGELLIYTNVLSTTERQMAGVYLKKKWGITSSYSVNQDVLPAATSVAITNNAALVLKTSAQTIGSLTGEAGGSVALDTLLTVNGSSSTTYAGNISGVGGLTKQGNGTLTLSGGTLTFTGDTTVEGGMLTVKNSALGSGRLVMGSAGTLEYNLSTGTWYHPRTDLSGTGSFIKTGVGTLLFGNSGAVNWNFSPGAQIDVRQGTIIGGWAINDFWVNNHASLSVSNGAAFRGMEANVRVAKLTGAGTVKTGYLTYASGYQSFTVGVDGESSTFDGTIANDETGGTVGALTKTGAGTLTLTGISSYTGNTTIDNGTLKVTGQLYSAGNYSNSTITVRNGGVLELNTLGYGSGASLGWLATDAARLLVSNGTIRVNGASLAAGRGATIQAGGATLEATSNALFRVCDAGAPWVFTGNPTLTLAGAGTGTFEMGFASSGALVKAGTGKWTLAGTNAYSGSVQVQSGTLQVMADVPTNTPAPGAAMWLDATRGVTTTIASGGKVTVWADQSGNGRNATNIWNTGPTVTTDINGLPTMRFTRSSNQFLGTGGLGGVSNLTLFIVHKDASINNFQTFIGTDGAWRNDTTNGLSVHLITAYQGARPLNYGVYPSDGLGTAGMVAGTSQIDEIVDSSGPWQLFLNGAANGSGSRTTVVKNLDSFRIGSWNIEGRYLDSSIGEILLYTNVLNAAERQATYAYLNGKWFNPARFGIIQCVSSNLLATSATVTVATGAALDLAGKSQTITSLSGGGLVTNGTLTVNNGTITPGGSNTVGTLTLAVTATLNGTLRVDIGAEGVSDRLVVAGALDLSGLTLVMENPGQLDKDRIYTIATCTGSLTGVFSSTPNLPASWKVRYNRTLGTVELIYLRGTMISFF